MEDVQVAPGSVASAVLDAAGRLVQELVRPGGGSPLAALTAARDLSAAAEAALQESADRARDAGQSWREIGEVLGTSRQAAFQRFGHPVDPRTGKPMIRDLPPGAADRALALFSCFPGGRWDQVLEAMDDRMRERHDAAILARGWAGMAGLFGAFERFGEPFAQPAGDDLVVVGVPLHFEAGEATGLVRFDQDGKVAGLRLQRAPEKRFPDGPGN